MAWIIQDTSYTCWSLSDQSLAQKESKIDYFYFFFKENSVTGNGEITKQKYGQIHVAIFKVFSCLVQVFTFYLSFLQVRVSKLLLLPSFVCTLQVLAVLMFCLKYYKGKLNSFLLLTFHDTADPEAVGYTNTTLHKTVISSRITVPFKNAYFGHKDEMCLH